MPTRTNVYANIVKTQSSPITSSRHGGFHAPKGNLTKNITASGWENTLRSVEILRPNKSNVVSYLGHSARPPPPWAHVVVVERAQQWA
jgi:hypothetical protein